MKHVAWEACPSCQEPVHPVAGRCKHCRADLVALRAEAMAARKRATAEARAAAATPLRVAMLEPAARPPAAAKSGSAGAARSVSSRRLMLLAAAVLFVGVAGGVVAQKVYARGSAASVPAVRHAIDPIAAQPPDRDRARDFQDPFPAPLDPSFVPDPDPGQGQGSGGNFMDPYDMLKRMMPMLPGAPGNLPAPRAPGSPPPDVNDVQLFVPALVDMICDKLTQCGLFEAATAGMCKMMASSLQDDETVERVRRGECHYDADAARQCLAAVGGMTCDNAADPGQMLGLMTLTDQIVSCSRTLDCP